MTIDIIRERLEQIVDESRGKTLKETNGIKHIGIDEQKNCVIVIVSMYKLGGQYETNLRRALARAVKLELGFTGIKIQLEEQRKLDSIVNTKVKFIMVISGKGGVGKSTVAVNIAYSLHKLGKKVAIIDADVYGSSIPKMLEMKPTFPEANENGKIKPFNSFGMELISTEFFAEPGKPVIWRGSMLNSMIQNFFYEVAWDKHTDYIIIDCPPGTGDVALDIKDIVPGCEAILVTTPHLAASHVAVKAGIATMKMNHKLIGVVENMSYYLNPATGKADLIFGEGGGITTANQLDSELLVRIPINQPTHHLSLYEDDEEIGQMYNDLATLILLRDDNL